LSPITEQKKEIVRARIRPTLKSETQDIFRGMGLTMSQAITLFLEQVRYRKALPFPVEIPNAETIAAMREATNPEDLKAYHSPEELFQDLDW